MTNPASFRTAVAASTSNLGPGFDLLGLALSLFLRTEAHPHPGRLELVCEGLPNREIADRLYLSVRTVEKHVESLLRKTSTRTRTQLARSVTST